LGRYVEFAKASFPRGMSLEEMRVAVDVANGAAYKSTPCILRELGADLAVAHNQPNGMNINDGCGSIHPDEIQRIVKMSGADVGIISALQILCIMRKSGEPLSKLKACLEKYPQAQRNLRVKEKRPLAELNTVMKLVSEAEKELSGKGRVLLRYSGTEPKIRLLIEGRELEKIDKQAERIADAIQSAIGAD